MDQIVAAQQGDVRTDVVACAAQGQGAHHDLVHLIGAGVAGGVIVRVALRLTLHGVLSESGRSGAQAGQRRRPRGGQQEGPKSHVTHPRYNDVRLDML
ncbi:hypothetical protein D3C73_855360 [compost metagenome]